LIIGILSWLVINQAEHMRHPIGLGPVMLVTTVVTWASAFPMITIGLRGFSPIALGEGRLLVAGLALAGAAVVLRPALPARHLWPRVVLAGLLGQALYQGLLMAGEVEVPAGTASILIATAPLFSLVAAVLLLGDTSPGRWTGMLVSFAGAALVGSSLGLGGGPFALLVLGAAACQGLYHVVVKPLAESIGAFAATAWSVWAGALLAAPGLPSLVGDVGTASANSVTALVGLGLIPSALGYLAWSVAVASVPIARSTVALYLVPVVALFLSWLLLGENPTPLALVGGALAVGGVVLVQRHRSPDHPDRPDSSDHSDSSDPARECHAVPARTTPQPQHSSDPVRELHAVPARTTP
jgi:terminal-alkyne amino-acid exporter